MEDPLAEWEPEGRVWLRGLCDARELAELSKAAETPERPGSRFTSADALTGCIRASAWAARLADLWPGARPVRVVSFDKSAAANWGVPWHQDRIIAVAERHEVPGFGNWSRKAGRWHCEPPAEVLDGMLFVRVHIDPNLESNGAMQIARGSHRAGVVPAAQAGDVAARYPGEVCSADPGDVLVLRMLTLHRSLPSASVQPRRALRVDFACGAPPAPLAWG